MIIDSNVKSEKANWKFDKEVTEIFDSHVRKSVPLYDNFHNTIGDLSEWFIEENTNVYDIGTSTGEGLSNLISHHKNKHINFIGIDNSKDMIEKSKSNLRDHNVTLINGDITSQDIEIHNASFITSILTLQFIPQRKRKQVIEKSYRGLNKGGALVIVEKIIGNNARFDEMFIELYHDFKLSSGLTEQEVFAKSRAIRGVMMPNTVQENIEILQEVGFKDVDIFFKWCNFVGFIAIK